MKLSGQQQEAMDLIVAWYESGQSQQCLLFGYAGTGKTTLAQVIANRLGVSVAYAAYTGKAAHVMRNKGCDGARTIHSLIYLPVHKVHEELEDLHHRVSQETNVTRRADLLGRIYELEQELRQPDWILNEDSDLREVDLLIVDEVSMVNKEMADDILSFGVPVLVLGDPAQLPPVDGAGFFTAQTPDYLLTEVHRQAANSFVIELATGIRSGHRLIEQRYSSSSVYKPVGRRKALKFNQVIVGTNRERWRRIHQLREMHGLSGNPSKGDKIICLANNRDLGVFNGQMFRVVSARDRRPKDIDSPLLMELRDDDGGHHEQYIWKQGFQGLQAEKDFNAHYNREAAFMTYGWAITCHKAQGSQWGSVLIVDDWRYKQRQRWLYTAVTRAQYRVALIRPRQGNAS